MQQPAWSRQCSARMITEYSMVLHVAGGRDHDESRIRVDHVRPVVIFDMERVLVHFVQPLQRVQEADSSVPCAFCRSVEEVNAVARLCRQQLHAIIGRDGIISRHEVPV